MKVRLQDIAARLHLSSATVSRALRSHPAISQRTRDAVVRAAGEMGYSVSYSHRGRKMHGGCERRGILVLVGGGRDNDCDLQNASGLTRETLKGISQVVNSHDAQLIIDFVDPFAVSGDELISRCEYFDGIIFLHYFEDDLIRRISRLRPCVSADYSYPGGRMDVVSGGDIEHFIFMIGYLRKKGFSRIGYLDFPNDHHPRGLRGYLGYLAGLSEVGLQAVPELILRNRDFSDEAGKIRRAVELTRKGKVQVWVCANDYMAAELWAAFAEAGIAVPEDVSLTGFGGIHLPGLPFQLCTFQTPFERIGQETAKYLFDRIRLPSQPSRHALLDCQFIEGNSVKWGL